MSSSTSSLAARIYRRALRPVDAFYYRFLLGRDSAWVRRMGAAVLAREQASGRGDVPLTQEAWEAQYGSGYWDFLDGADEIPRYSVIAGFVQALGGAGTLLDVGCGEGLLLRHLEPVGSYLGIDLSQVAIERARTHGHARERLRARFEVADAEAFEVAEPMGAVVLNECLYYFHDPVAQARRYLAMLAPGGVMVVSMFRHRRSRAIERLLERALEVRERVVVGCGKGEWVVLVFARDGGPDLRSVGTGRL